MPAQGPEIVFGKPEPVDILAFGPHPDDIEIGAAGSLLLWADQGYRIGLVDLTCGEMGTKGDAEARKSEAAEAARLLGAQFRLNLRLPDGAVVDDPANRERVTQVLRSAQPAWVLCNLADSRHPDHAAGAWLLQASFFLSRLPKYLPGIPAHSPRKLVSYLIHEQVAPSFCVDITPTFERKFEVLKAYRSQFVEPELPEGYIHAGLHDYLSNVRALGEAWGAQAGVKAAEAFVTNGPLVVRDIDQWIRKENLIPPAPFSHQEKGGQ
jgi:bacillithiol biosynthesis deacetylase BshB1